MRPPKSAYYPPRARWYGRFLSSGQSLVRRLPLEHLRLPGGFNLRQFLLALAVPGYVFFVLGRARFGQIVLGAYGFWFLVALVWLGSSLANLAFGLMVALHAMSWASLLEVWLQPGGWQRRLLLALFAALLVATIVYLPAQRYIQSHLVAPLRVGGATLLVAPTRELSVRPGATAIFRVDAGGAPGLRIRQGFMVAEILGQSGDRIRFRKGHYYVNEQIRMALPQMPADGEWVVPENHWFIWPFSGIGIQGNLSALDPITAHATLRGLALVPKSAVIGRPLRWWFWRKLYVP
ncbi:MAG: hypothetical protein KJ072_09650 [Verrucomicrobia bacterium]|nr:hypothetical protein [Verrucomicrobiota bacterium]